MQPRRGTLFYDRRPGKATGWRDGRRRARRASAAGAERAGRERQAGGRPPGYVRGTALSIAFPSLMTTLKSTALAWNLVMSSGSCLFTLLATASKVRLEVSSLQRFLATR